MKENPNSFGNFSIFSESIEKIFFFKNKFKLILK